METTNPLQPVTCSRCDGWKWFSNKSCVRHHTQHGGLVQWKPVISASTIVTYRSLITTAVLLWYVQQVWSSGSNSDSDSGKTRETRDLLEIAAHKQWTGQPHAESQLQKLPPVVYCQNTACDYADESARTKHFDTCYGNYRPGLVTKSLLSGTLQLMEISRPM